MNRRKLISLIGATGFLALTGFTERHNNILKIFSQTGNNNSTITNKNLTMKTIGILGGIGPQATINFETMIHDAARQILPPLYNSGYPPMVVYYHRYAPVLIKDDLTPVLPIQPEPRLLKAAKDLGSMVDFLVITSNGVHSMQNEIETVAGKKVLSMIDTTLEEVIKRKWGKVGVIGYRNSLIYNSRLKSMGIEFEMVSDELQQQFDTAVMRVMEGRDTVADTSLAVEMVNYLRAKNVDGIILGCTELPLLLKEIVFDADLLNPARLLAIAAVKQSLS